MDQKFAALRGKEKKLTKLRVLSLHRRGDDLADPANQIKYLEQDSVHPRFDEKLREQNLDLLKADGIDILQVNVGKMCNMTCAHCHVDAGPDRREIMKRQTIDDCLSALESAKISTLDLTGGAPEMNPDFKYFVESARSIGVHVIDRCNLTILLANGYKDMADFLAENHVEIVASLPCYLEENADSQRGDGSFRKSIKALKLLNSLGYGRGDSDHRLTLVYNPVGPSLPPDQGQLELAYRDELRSRYEIEFDRLFTITNMPISRYLEYLLNTGDYEQYMVKLIEAFNPSAANGVMCRKMLSVGWDGFLFDCDFNQMLALPTEGRQPKHIADFDLSQLGSRPIVTGRHCFGCTAAAGSGCLGAIEQ
ncbi:MAG: arsenosugar biosynthesis radical SAM (seleno)protein ArsS [Planctomycetota bacterium]